MGDRVTFSVTDATRPRVSGEYDLVRIFEALHGNVTPGRRTPGGTRDALRGRPSFSWSTKRSPDTSITTPSIVPPEKANGGR